MNKHQARVTSAVFITFSGNCKTALTFYQHCFGGTLHFETFDKALEGFRDMPVVSGSLVSDRITIHGSDLVPNEGRKLGNYISVFLHCKDIADREMLIEKLEAGKRAPFQRRDGMQQLMEVCDAFDVRWVLGI